MTVDPELHDRLSRLRDAHQPDRDRIRARFEAGLAAEVDPAPASARRRMGGSWVGAPARVAAALVVVGLAATGVVVSSRDRPATVEAGGASVTAGVAPPYVPPTTPAPSTTAPAAGLPPGTAVATTGLVDPGPAASDPTTAPGAAGAPASAPGGSSATSATGSGPAPTSPPPSTAAPAGAGLCRHKDEADLGRLHLVNDLWGADRSTAGNQCVTVTGGSPAGDGSVAWSTRWSWAGAPGQPKSFSNVYLGWDWGWKEADSGLPRNMADRPGIRSRWDFTVAAETPGRMEVAYDLWFHNRPDPAGDTLPVSEVRIILYRTPADLPAGGRQGTVTLEGGTWDVYRFGSSWDVVTFYRTSPTTSADVDLGRFLDEAARYTRLPWLTSIHAGVGVNDGAGQVDTTRFSLTLS